MAQVDLIMPKMGESVAEATIIKWLKKCQLIKKLESIVLDLILNLSSLFTHTFMRLFEVDSPI